MRSDCCHNGGRKVPIPVLGKQLCLELIQSDSRSQRESDASIKLYSFRQNARKRAAFRMWRQAKAQLGLQKLGKVTLINFSPGDADALAAAIPRFYKNLGIKCPISLMVISSDTNLRDAQGSVYLVSQAGERWWAQAWRQGFTKLVCLSLPNQFGPGELLFGDRTDASPKRLKGRVALLHYLLAGGLCAVAEWEDLKGLSQRLAEWKIRIDVDPELYFLQLIGSLSEA